LKTNGERLKPIIRELKDAGIRVSLFLDFDSQEIETAKAIGADRIELYTEPYAKFYNTAEQTKILTGYQHAAERAAAAGLGVNAGHDLNLENLGTFLQIPGILEVSIGHALIVESLTLGLEKTIRSYLAITG
jgi:pyridoxine 5-phosphate synthase